MRSPTETEEEKTSETISSPINPIRYPLRAHFFGYAESHLVSIKRRESGRSRLCAFRISSNPQSHGRKLYISSILATRRFHPCLERCTGSISCSGNRTWFFPPKREVDLLFNAIGNGETEVALYGNNMGPVTFQNSLSPPCVCVEDEGYGRNRATVSMALVYF